MVKPNASKTKKQEESIPEVQEKKEKTGFIQSQNQRQELNRNQYQIEEQKQELKKIKKNGSCETNISLPFPAIHSSFEITKHIQLHLKQQTISWYFPKACDKAHKKEGSGNPLAFLSSQNIPIRGGKLTREAIIFSKEFWSAKKNFFVYPVRAHVRAFLLDKEDLHLPYVPPVSLLLKLGRPTSHLCEVNFLQIELSQVDVPPLLQMVRDRTLLEATGKSRRKWGPLHAAKALGRLNQGEYFWQFFPRWEISGSKLISFLDYNDAWYLAELPNIIASAGAPALKLSFEYLKDGSRWMKGRIAAVIIIDKIVVSQYYKEPKLFLTAAQTLKEVLCRPSTQGSLAVEILSSKIWRKALQIFMNPTKIQEFWCIRNFSFSCLCKYVKTKHDIGNREPKEVCVQKKKAKLHYGNTGVEENKCWWEPLKEGSKKLIGEHRQTQIGPSIFLCNFCSRLVCVECSKNCELCNQRTCHFCFTSDSSLERDVTLCYSCSQTSVIGVIGGKNKERLTESIEKTDKGKVTSSTAQIKGLGLGISEFPSLAQKKGDKRKELTNWAGKQSSKETGSLPVQNSVVGDSRISGTSSNSVEKSHFKKEDEEKLLKKMTDSNKSNKKVMQVGSKEAKNGLEANSNGAKTNMLREGWPQNSQYEKSVTVEEKETHVEINTVEGTFTYPADDESGKFTTESVESTSELIGLMFVLTEAEKAKDRGNIYFKKEQYVEAMREYDDACKLLEGRKRIGMTSPDFLQLRCSIFLNLAASQLKLGMYRAVVNSCTSAINVGDRAPCAKGFFRRGMAYFKMGQLVQAHTDLSTALQLLPGDKLVQQELDRVTDALSKELNSNNPNKKTSKNTNKKNKSQGAIQEGKKKEVSVKKGAQGGQSKNERESTNEGRSQKEKSEPGKGETVSKDNSSQKSGNDGKKESSSKNAGLQTRTGSEKTGGKDKVLSEKEKKANKAKKVAEKAALRAEAERQARLKQEREEEEYQRALEKRRKELEEQEILEAERRIREREEMERKQRIEEMMKNQEEESRQWEREEKLAILQAKFNSVANERPSYSEDAHSGRLEEGSSRDMTSSSTNVRGVWSGEGTVPGANLQEIFPFFFPPEVNSSRSSEPERQSVSGETQNSVQFGTDFPPLNSGSSSFPHPPRLNSLPPFPPPPPPHLFGDGNNVGYSDYAPVLPQNQNNNFSSGYSGYTEVRPSTNFFWDTPYSVNTQSVPPQNDVFQEIFQSNSTFPPHFLEANVASGGGRGGGGEGGGPSWDSSSGSEYLENGKKWQNEVEESTCAICFEAERDALILPCSHLSTCTKCIETVKNSSRPLCPICRMTISSIITVDFGTKRLY